MLPGFTPFPEELAEGYRALGCWRGETFGQMLRERAERYGNRTAVVGGEIRLSYQELDRQTDRLAAGFSELGIELGDRVVVQLPNIPEFLTVCFALFRLGALPVFSLPAHRSNEITYFCEHAEVSVYIIPDVYGGFDYRELAKHVQEQVTTLQHVIVVGEPGDFLSLEELYRPPISLPPVSSEEVAFLQLSGGSTGLPKLIPRTHDDYIYTLRLSAEICELDENSVYLCVLPVSHNYPLSSPGVLGTLYAGGRVVLSPTPSPDDAFPLIEKERVTITGLVPPLALVWTEAVSTRDNDLSSLQVLQVGGSKLGPEAARRAKEVFRCTLQQVFGMAEGLVNYTRLDDPDEIVIHTQGRPMSPYDEIRVVDEQGQDVEPGEVGQLLTRGPYTIRRYYKADEQHASSFTPDGYYRTSDLVRITSSGHLIVEGRIKDQINRGGDKVSSEEVENHLLAHPAVFDAAVVSVPDDFLGERSCAYIIPRRKSPTAGELKSFLRERGLAVYKIPDQVEFVDSFPQTGVGKVSKKDLREALRKGMESV